jgi:hypothetical protein
MTRTLAWSCGALEVQTLGAMLGPLSFRPSDEGQAISPLAVAPWADEPDAQEELKTLPGLLRRLRGEWPCIPFGATFPKEMFPQEWRPDEGLRRNACDDDVPAEPHGYPSNHDWSWEESSCGPDRLTLTIAPPDPHPIALATRSVAVDLNAPRIEIGVTVVARRSGLYPIGVHPTFVLPDKEGTLSLRLPNYDHVLTFPTEVEPEHTRLVPNRKAKRLYALPAAGGGTADATRLPWPHGSEDLVQVVGLTEGRLSLSYDCKGMVRTVLLNWDVVAFPHLCLWLSQGGRQGFPWLNRHRALGVEPMAGAFDLGTAVARSTTTPLARAGWRTGVWLDAGKPWRTTYSIALQDSWRVTRGLLPLRTPRICLAGYPSLFAGASLYCQ